MNKFTYVLTALARVLVVAFALCALGCFVFKAHQDANPPAPEVAPEAGGDAADGEPRPASFVQPLDEVTVTPRRNFLPSSKSLVIEMDGPQAPAQQPVREPTMLHGSKSAVIIESTPDPFLRSSKVGVIPVQAFQQGVPAPRPVPPQRPER